MGRSWIVIFVIFFHTTIYSQNDMLNDVFSTDSINKKHTSVDKLNKFLDRISSLKLNNSLSNRLSSSFENVEGLIYEKYSFEVNNFLNKKMYDKALDVNTKHYKWYLLTDKKNAYLITILLRFDKIYKNINEDNFNRNENFKLIVKIINNDKALFDKVGMMGYEIPIIAQELGFKHFSEKYFIEYLENQLPFFYDVLISNNNNRENWIRVISEIINEILVLNLKQDFIIDKNLVFWIDLLNKFEYKDVLFYDKNNSTFPIEPDILDSYDNHSILFREYYDYNKREYRVVIFYIGINNKKYYLLSKENYPIYKIWKHKIINKKFLNDIFSKIKSTNNLFIISSGLDTFMNFSAYLKDFESINEKKIKIININSLESIQTYENIYFNSEWSIELFGDIDYGKPSYIKKRNNRDIKINNMWSYLPGTLYEIDAISELADKYNIKFNKYSGLNVNVQAITNLSYKNESFVIHLATHGFFIENKTVGDSKYLNKLLDSNSKLNKSGVILSGGNNDWFSEFTEPNIKDSILTSKEIEGIDLSNCKLAILSSCYSGRADTSTPNHIAGIQTALRTAGVKKIILSNFEISDNKSPIFFEYFYSELFKGRSIHSAFTNTQKEMRKRYGFEDDFWTSFILLE